jgi:transcriptional regulator GlxA family with amidase domain
MEQQRNVALLLFDDVEVQDFCGSFGVFAVTRRPTDQFHPFVVYTVAESSDSITTRNGMSINPNYTLTDCPPPDILIVPGGYGTRREMGNIDLLDWINARAVHVELLLSVSTGALLLAKAGLLDGLEVTTHHGAINLLRRTAPDARVVVGKRFIDNGQIITAGGISAGLDMALHVVQRLLGTEQARWTASHIEYDWH